MQARAEAILKQLSTDASSMMQMARYERYDAFTFGHSIRVCFIALNFARHLTDDMHLVERIGLSALMHDVGKAWVPFDVLHSNARLSDEERAEMNMHPIHGGQILLGNANADPLAVAVAFSHHRNANGSGYPQAVHPGAISTATMIVKIADVYEALTAARPYKPRMSPTRAYRIMMDMNDHFEPSLLRRFIEVNGFYPVGSRVRLSSGELARVVEQTDDMVRPYVLTEVAASGEALFSEDVAKLDLRHPNGRDPLSIQEIILDEVA
jgi:HD-GYP domain-containing protein (c-di-GMP phosphodiesterase class II)